MILNPSPRAEARPTRWGVLAGVGLLGVAVAVTGVGFSAETPPNPPNVAPSDAPKPADKDKAKDKDKAEKPKSAMERIRDLHQKIATDPNVDLEAMMREQEKLFAEFSREIMQNRGNIPLPPQVLPVFPGDPNNPFGGVGGARIPAIPGAFAAAPQMPQGDGRLGVRVEKPAASLADQLDLPEGQGLVIGEVKADSAASKAGLKTHDILLEFAGKPVPSEPAEFIKTLRSMKADQGVDVVVMRKGRRETIKGIKLPEVRAEARGDANDPFQPPQGVPALPNFPRVAPPPFVEMPRPGAIVDGIQGGRVSRSQMSVNGDSFTMTQQDDARTITITGSREGGSFKPESIVIDDGGQKSKADSLDKVPEKYQDAVKVMLKRLGK
jgi:hypothetical protein